MGDIIKDNPVLSWVIGFVLCVLISLTVARFYIDYRIDSKYASELRKTNIAIERIVEGLENGGYLQKEK